MQPKHCLLNINRNSEFGREIWNTCRRVISWWNLSKFVVSKHLGWDILRKECSTPFYFTIYILKWVFCWDISVEVEWVWSMCNKFKWKVETTAENDGTTPLKISPRFIAPRQSFAVEFVAIKQFEYESLHVEPSCCLDVVVYMLNCVFWWHNLLEIEFKSRGDAGSDSSMHSGITNER